MTIRTTRETITFKRPFMLAGSEEVLPAGAYRVDIDEELLEGLSFSAYRRVQTMIHLQPDASRPGLSRTLTVQPGELEAALERDGARTGEPE
ncbi:hypothetical protein ACM64Y_06385 [Novispirillum sp. DQ9]|uniref:hypothetical protein n=1 Tax=Novispirillum sp. DQ9 TaxID=3398612 RepID=UPI003C7ABA99